MPLLRRSRLEEFHAGRVRFEVPVRSCRKVCPVSSWTREQLGSGDGQDVCLSDFFLQAESPGNECHSDQDQGQPWDMPALTGW